VRGDYEDWEDGALCKQIGIWAFYSDGQGGNPYAFGKRICGMCCVREPCLERALRDQEQFGLWGGETPRSRLQLLRQRFGPDFDWPEITT
jgi:WhiB family redox-sensing transcriptional regulator